MRILLALALCLGLATHATAAETIEMQTCTDANGRSFKAQADTSLPVIVRFGGEDGRRVIRHNPELFPELSPLAREFFFAQSCARLAMGLPPAALPTPAQARRADCVALGTLQASGLIGQGAAAIDRLQNELAFSDEEWQLLPGPKHAIDLSACSAQPGVVRLPLRGEPTAAQMEQNACVRQCGDRLYACQGRGKRDGEGACLSTYQQCEAGCKTR